MVIRERTTERIAHIIAESTDALELLGIRLHRQFLGRISTAACTPSLTINIDAGIDAVYHLTDSLHGFDVMNTHQVETETIDMIFVYPVFHALQHKLAHERLFRSSNRVVDSNAERKNALKVDNGHYYKWKEGNIFYTKTGTGEPILLIHDTDSGASGEEWAKVAKKLAKNNTVYTIDLLGCGRSDKPSIQYTSYMYVQIITAFVNDVIGKPVNVAATNLSTAPVIMANALSKDLFNKIILINPVSLQQLSCIPDKSTKFKQNIINLPIIGTFIYNKLMSPIKVDLLFRNKFILRSQLISDKMKDAYYESAHKGQSRGKYLYSSILSNYINTNIAPALKNLDKDVSIIASTGIKNNMDVINNYHKLNSKCDIIHIANAKLYPQLELPEKTASIIKKIVTN